MAAVPRAPGRMIDADLIIAFLVAITLLAAVARRIGTPYPVWCSCSAGS